MNKPRIVCAANKYIIKYSPDENEELIITGARHWDSIMRGVCDTLDEYTISCIDRNTEEQGFIDQFGNFLTRQEAYIVAKEHNQIIRDHEDADRTQTLYSENLY